MFYCITKGQKNLEHYGIRIGILVQGCGLVIEYLTIMCEALELVLGTLTAGKGIITLFYLSEPYLNI